jgi:DNA-binding YbaB/EbfC family protein
MSNPFDLLGGMGGMGGLGNMMASFQQQMQTIQEQVAQQQFTAQTGGGLVSVTVNGNNEVVSIEFSDAASDDLELLADLIQVATNQALQQAKTYSAQQMQALTAGLPIPPGMLGMLGM